MEDAVHRAFRLCVYGIFLRVLRIAAGPAFARLIAERCIPVEVQPVDPEGNVDAAQGVLGFFDLHVPGQEVGFLELFPVQLQAFFPGNRKGHYIGRFLQSGKPAFQRDERAAVGAVLDGVQIGCKNLSAAVGAGEYLAVNGLSGRFTVPGVLPGFLSECLTFRSPAHLGDAVRIKLAFAVFADELLLFDIKAERASAAGTSVCHILSNLCFIAVL